MEEVINNIYRNNFKYRSRWNTGLANHVPMAAAAMYLMRHETHIKQEKLIHDAVIYSEHLSPRRINDCKINMEEISWTVQRQLLGHDDYQESWQAYFKGLFDTDIDTTISTWLPRLGLGLSAAAGHSIIRFHYALALREVLEPEVFKEEIAVSFADLASRYLELTSDSNLAGDLSLERFLENHPCLAEPELKIVKAGSLIEDRFFLLKTQSAYQDIAQTIALEFDLVECLRLLASMAIEAVDFTLLHAITVGQSLLDIFKWFPQVDDASMRQGYRDYVVMAILAGELPHASDSDYHSVCLDDIYSRVPGLKNDHAQKASYSLTRLYKASGYHEFLSAADCYQKIYG